MGTQAVPVVLLLALVLVSAVDGQRWNYRYPERAGIQEREGEEETKAKQKTIEVHPKKEKTTTTPKWMHIWGSIDDWKEPKHPPKYHHNNKPPTNGWGKAEWKGNTRQTRKGALATSSDY